jgi:ribonuclease E
MKSGGYLVINPTEALVSIDVNSGRATKERHIEETALKTNLEAADEVARQLRLRDLGGLVVIDFIDMEDRRNNGKVERRLRDALSSDRARIQVGRISSFGLLELSRQRLNPSLTEAQFESCPTCEGTGNVRTPDSTSILVLRSLEEEGLKGRAAQLIVHVTTKVALFLLNNKRANVTELEKRYDLEILIRVDDEMAASAFRIEVSRPAEKQGSKNDNDDQPNDSASDSTEEDGEKKSRSRGRRGGRKRGNRDDNQNADNQGAENQNAGDVKADDVSSESSDVEAPKDAEKDEKPKRKRAPSKKQKEDTVSENADAPVESASEAPAEEKAKTPAKAKPTKAKAAEKSAEASKTAAPPAPEEPKEYEVVNEAPKEKKKGWWNKLTD